MEAVKDTVQNVMSTVSGKAEEKAKDTSKVGEYDKPDDFPSQTQKGSVVGIQADMKNKPVSVQQEEEGGFEAYKAAGKLQGKTALITGGDSGIGRSVAVMYAMEGADVAIIYLPEEEEDAQETKRLCLKYAGKGCLCYPQDIREEAGVELTITSIVKAFNNKLDILVNNASVMYSCPNLEDITTEQFDRTVKTNIYGTFFVTKSALKYIPKGGSIIVTVSQVAYAGSKSLVDYTMTKGAGVGFVRSLSLQLLDKGIRVNGVAPGPIWTPLQPAAMDQKTLDEWQSSPAPMGRIGQPAELGPAYVLLASSDGSFIAGQVIHVNGGSVLNG